MVLVLLTNDKGLGPADEAGLPDTGRPLHGDSQDVVMLQDFVATPPLRETLTSQDGKAWILPVGSAGDVGLAGVQRRVQTGRRHRQTHVAGTTLTANLTGTAATVADLIDVSEQDQVRIEAAIIILLFIILLIIYRNLITMLLPLITIGLSLVIAQTVLAGSRVGPGGFDPDHCFPQRDDRRRGNGLRRLSHQPLSRLLAARREFGSSGKEAR